jgi:methionine-rich copper-binding protein CopC
MRRVTRILAVALAAALGLAGAASAHAILVGSQPKQASEVQGPDVDVSLEFNSRIDPDRSSLVLVRAAESEHELAPVGAGPQPLALLPSGEPNRLDAKASGLEPGTYRLRWQVLSVDGHVSRGDVTFKVRAP